MRRFRAVTLIVAGLLEMIAAGCVGEDPVVTTPSGPADAAAPTADAAGGNDGGTSSTGGAIDRFLGTWTTTTGTQVVEGCSGAGTQNNISVKLEVTKGATGDILATNSLAPSCVLKFRVTGDDGKLVDGQTCTANFPGRVDTYTYSPQSTFQITSADGTKAVVKLFAAVTSTSGPATCNFTETDPYTKQ